MIHATRPTPPHFRQNAPSLQRIARADVARSRRRGVKSDVPKVLLCALFGNAEESLHQFDPFPCDSLQERIYFPVRRQIFPALPHRENVPKPLK
jgi:hypothetical protein